ncbi:hypothetical protein D9757_008179 [Collybiopsis confluens]|uniref:Methyltransferase domain-containing protein n=1 Tax=Collybiopsis confluens TaxID=2823264 RepID=A0A8H5HE40_9AGAR|nr:hypothetical protein D9757_008179 [Collybiopsis confluens]
MDRDDQVQERYYADKEYLLPNDRPESARLNVQHRAMVKGFGGLALAQFADLHDGDRVLESGAGTGIWALEFSKQIIQQYNVTLDIQAIDISDKQFPRSLSSSESRGPPNIHFSIHSVLDLPSEWTATFSYAHQRLLILAMSDSRWYQSLSELFRVLRPGGYLELVEPQGKHSLFAVGPFSKRLADLIQKMYVEKGVVTELGEYLPRVLGEIGFVDVRVETRRFGIGIVRRGDHHRRSLSSDEREDDGGSRYSGEEWRDLWEGLKEPIVAGGGYGFLKTEREYAEILDGAMEEWNEKPDEGYAHFYTIVARKP